MARTKSSLTATATDDSTKKTAKKAAKKQARLIKSLEKDGGKSNVGGGSSGGIKKPHRWRRGTVAMRQIRKYQSGRTIDGTRPLIPKTSLGRRIRDKAGDYADDVRFQGSSLAVVQTSTEALMHDILADTARLTALRKMKTVTRENFLFIVSMYFKDYLYNKLSKKREADAARQRRERVSEL